MKKKVLIIVPIIIIVAFIIALLPKNNNTIKETMAETNLPESTPEITPSPKPTVEPTSTPTPTLKPEPTPTPEEIIENDDVTLGDGEYKGDNLLDSTENYDKLSKNDKDAVDQIVDQLMKEHPEWFSEEGTGNGTTQQGSYEHVGTPDNTANTPQIVFGQGDYSQLGDGVTVY